MKNEDLKKLVKRTFRTSGDAIEGNKVIAHARKILVSSKKVKGTSKHSLGQVVLQQNCLCVLDKTFSVVRDTGSEPKP